MKTALRVSLIMIIAFVSFNNAAGQKSARKTTISGYVTDETHASVANAIIMIDGKGTNFVTDSKGFYKIKVRNGTQKIGILTTTNGIMEEEINGRTRINFTFKGTVPAQAFKNGKSDPGDDVVDVGYGKVRKRDLTTPVNKVDGSQAKYASYRTIYDMIRGEVPGVMVNGTKITIQGITSINLSTDPLFVVDGQVVTTIDDIQPYMVKSINILKGSSASIYGSRGANGVILINLKGAGDN
jgi:TonB-dependent SusC/RagA subfamily outer membrane receptor